MYGRGVGLRAPRPEPEAVTPGRAARERNPREESHFMPGRVVIVDAVDPRVTLNVLSAVKRGDFSARMPANWTGTAGRVAAALNEIIESNQRLERELQRLSKRVGKEGQMKRAPLGDAGGAWASTLDAVNDLIEDLARPNAEMGRVIRAVASGDLTQTMPMEIDGRRLQGQI